MVVAATMGVGCAMALHPHTTATGQRFASERSSEVHEGQTTDEVAAILGAPLEDRPEDGLRVWRYFEQFQPRGCTPVVFGFSLGGRPTWTREVVVTFRNDRAETVQIARRGGTAPERIGESQNNQMQRTAPGESERRR